MGFTRLGKNFVVLTKENSLTIRPGVITTESSNPLGGNKTGLIMKL